MSSVKRSPADKPELLSVPSLDVPLVEPTRIGRPKKLVAPPLPKALLDGMTDLEVEWFWFFINAVKEAFKEPELTAFETIETYMAAMDFINTLRLEVQQLSSNNLVTMSRQHPAVQCRAWIDQLRKGRQGNKVESDPEKEQFKRLLLG